MWEDVIAAATNAAKAQKEREEDKDDRKQLLHDLDEILDQQDDVDENGPHSLEGLAARIWRRQTLGAKLFWYAMCAGGFCSPVDSERALTIYGTIWICSFFLCGFTCFANLYMRETPYHLFPVDLMVAVIHVPGLYSVIFWRQALMRDEIDDDDDADSADGSTDGKTARAIHFGDSSDSGSDEDGEVPDPFKPRLVHPIWQVLAFVKKHKELCCHCGGMRFKHCDHYTFDERLKRAVGFTGRLIIVVQITMIGLVLAGFAYPAWVFSKANPGHKFVWLHAWSMWFVIPPVVSCIVTSGAFFGFFLYLHYLEAEIVGLLFKTWKVGAAGNIGSVSSVTTSNAPNSADFDAAGKPWTKKQRRKYVVWGSNHVYRRGKQIADMHFANEVISRLSETFLHVQDRLDQSCKSWSLLVILYLAVAFLSLLAAAYDCTLIIQGEGGLYHLETHIYYVDIFLVGSGLLETAGFLCMGAMLTNRMDALAIDCIVGMRARGVPPHMAFSAFAFIGGRDGHTGFKILDIRVDTSHVILYFSGISTLLGVFIANAELLSRGVAL